MEAISEKIRYSLSYRIRDKASVRVQLWCAQNCYTARFWPYVTHCYITITSSRPSNFLLWECVVCKGVKAGRSLGELQLLNRNRKPYGQLGHPANGRLRWQSSLAQLII